MTGLIEPDIIVEAPSVEGNISLDWETESSRSIRMSLFYCSIAFEAVQMPSQRPSMGSTTIALSSDSESRTMGEDEGIAYTRQFFIV